MRTVTDAPTATQYVGRAVVALCATALLVACGDRSTRPTELPTPTPSPSATPAPTPTPNPTNRAPTVAISGAESCHPQYGDSGVRPCTVALEANAQDPDGDALSYAWSGCASGTARTASCALDRIADFTATVSVSDGHGHDVVASKVLHGVNAVPTNQMSFYCYYGRYPSSIGTCSPEQQPNCPPVPTGTYVDCGAFFNAPVDQEGDEVVCDEVVVSGSGCPPSGYYECSVLASAASFDLHTPTAPTVCTYEAYMRDAWGARFKVATIRLPVVQP